MSGSIELAIVMVIAVGVGWLTVRAWRMRNIRAQRAVGLAGALVVLLLGAVAVVGMVGVYRLYAPRGAPAAEVTLQVTPDQLVAGARRASGCTGCHSSS